MKKTGAIIIVLAMFSAGARDVFADFSRIEGANEVEKEFQVAKGKNKGETSKDPTAGMKDLNVNTSNTKVITQYTNVVTVNGARKSEHFTYETDNGKGGMGNMMGNMMGGFGNMMGGVGGTADDYFEQQRKKFEEKVKFFGGGQGMNMNFGGFGNGATGYKKVTTVENGVVKTFTETYGDDKQPTKAQEPESNPALERAYRLGMLPNYKPPGQNQYTTNTKTYTVDEYNKKLEAERAGRNQGYNVPKTYTRDEYNKMIEDERKRQEEHEKAMREKREQAAEARKKFDAEREMKELQARQARMEAERVENERKAQAEKDRLAREEARRLENEKRLKEDQEKRAREMARAKELEKKAQEEYDRINAQKDQLRRDREERDRIAREKKIKEDQDRRDREEKDRIAREKKIKEDQDRRDREERDRIAREKKEKEDKDRRDREERDRIAREKKVQEEKDRLAREEAEKADRAKKAREEADRLARQNRGPTRAYQDPLANIGKPPEPLPKANDFTPTSAVETANQTPVQNELGRPIKIIFEKSYLFDSIDKLPRRYSKEEKADFVKKIIEIIEKTDSFLRNYMFSKIPERTIVVPENFNQCVPSNDDQPYQLDKTRLNKKQTYVADLLIFVFTMDQPNDTELASALPCKTFPDGTAMFGTLRINIGKVLKKENVNNPFQMAMAIQVIVHEIFHIIAFHSSVQTDFYKKVDANYPHLYKFKQYNIEEAVSRNAHWNQDYIYNDLMIPEQLSNTVLSIFSLEYIELANKNVYATYRKNLQNNVLLDQIKDWKHFLTYRCDDQDMSAYPHYCTENQFQTRSWSCDPTYQFVNVCDNKQNVKTKCLKNVPHQKYICADTLTQREEDYYSVYSAESRCFESPTGRSATCFKTKIENNKLYVLGPEGQYECLKKGDPFNLEFKKPREPDNIYSVTFSCPDPRDFIDKFKKTNCPEFCNYNGVCNAGTCHCFEGYSQKDNCKYRNSYDHLTIFMEAYK